LRTQRNAVAKRARRVRERLGLSDAPPRPVNVRGDWSAALRVDPIPLLLGCGHPAIEAFTRRDLLDDRSVRVSDLWELPEACRVLARQQPDGRWRYPNPKPEIRSVDDYDQLETYRQLSGLVHRFGFDRRHPAVEAAKGFLATFQTADGDYRGIYGPQYTPNYSAAITEVLIHAGYGRDPQVEATMRWLVAVRQHDGGWAIPSRTRGERLDVMRSGAELVEPDRTRPSSHLVTGIVLRAFAAHPRRRRSAAARDAARWLATRIFQRDHYPDHAAPSYWTVFSYPFWWTDLLSALDTFTTLGWTSGDRAVASGVEWFVEHQDPGGLWNPGRNRPKRPDSDHWVALAICRALRRAGTASGG